MDTYIYAAHTQVVMDPLHAALATKLIEWAGLKGKVTVVIGESGKVIPTLRERYAACFDRLTWGYV